MLIEDGFREAFSAFDLDKLEMDDALVIGLDSAFTIRLLNPAWERAATEFGYPSVGREWTLGRRLLDAISGPTQHTQERRLTEALEAAQPFYDEYDCDDELYERRFGLVYYPLVDRSGLLLVHSPRHVVKRGEAPGDDLRRRFQTPEGLMLRCAGCKRFKARHQDALWQFTSGGSLPPEKVSHVMCHTCSAFFWGPSSDYPDAEVVSDTARFVSG